MTDAQAFAISLYVAGAVFAIIGPAIAAVRLASRYRRSTQLQGTAAELNASVDREKVQDAAFRDAAWGTGEFALVALGVVLAALGSIVSIIG